MAAIIEGVVEIFGKGAELTGEIGSHSVKPINTAVEASNAELKAAEAAAKAAPKAAGRAAVSETEAGSKAAVESTDSTAKTGQDFARENRAKWKGRTVKVAVVAGGAYGVTHLPQMEKVVGDVAKDTAKGLATAFNKIVGGFADGCHDAEGGCPVTNATDWVSGIMKTAGHVLLYGGLAVGGTMIVYEVYQMVTD